MSIAAFTLTSAASQAAAPFAIGHAFKQGDVPAGAQLVGGFSDMQVTPKNVWADGSLKFAIVAGRAAITAGVPLSVALSIGTPAAGTALTTGDLKATGIVAAIAAGAFGSVSWATTDWDAPFMVLASGPRMSSWSYRRAVGSDPHLVAWLEVRLWSGGEVEVLPWIENGYVSVAAPINKNATYSFTLGGTSRFSAAVDLLNHQRTVLVSGSTFSHWLDVDPAVLPNHDKAYLQASKLVPKYASITPDASIWAGLAQTFAPLQQGNYSPGMGTPGYHPSIGLLPEWDVLYLVSNDARAYAGVITNAYGSGRFGIHYRDQSTNRPPKFSDWPHLVLDGSSGVQHTGSSSTGQYEPASTGSMAPAWTDTHCPSVGFMPYLITGRFYFAEEMQFAAVTNFLLNSDFNRQNSAGIFLSSSGSNTTRGAAWANRTLAQAAALTPDADPLQVELINSVAANVDWNHARHVAQANNPQGFVQPYSDYTSPTNFNAPTTSGSVTVVFPVGYVFVNDEAHDYTGFYNGYQLAIGTDVRIVTAYNGATRTATVDRAFTSTSGSVAMSLRTDNVYFEATWMQDFYTAAFGYMIDLGVPLTSDVKAKLLAFFVWKAQSVVGRLGGTGATEYLYSDAAVYNIAVAPADAADWPTGTGPWFANWGAVYLATLGTANPGVDPGLLRGGNFPEMTSYWGNLQPALSYAVQHGVTGAGAARARMTGASNYSSLTADFAIAPVWAIEPHSAGAAMPGIGPTTRVDAGNWIPNCTPVSTTGGLGVLAQNITSVVGPAGTSPLYDLLQFPTDTDCEIRWTFVSGLSLGGTLVLEEDGRLYYSGPPDTCVIEYWRAGVTQGTANLVFASSGGAVTVNVTLGAATAAGAHANVSNTNNIVINATLGAAAAAGVTATITNTGGVIPTITITCNPGAAVAAGVHATVVAGIGTIEVAPSRILIGTGIDQPDLEGTFVMRAGRPTIDKDPDADLFYACDLAAELAASDASLVSVIGIAQGIVASVEAFVQGTLVVVKCRGGIVSDDPDVINAYTFRWTNTFGEVDDRTLYYRMVNK